MATHQELYKQYGAEIDRLIQMRLSRIYIPEYSRDDLIQEGRIAAFEALKSYDDTKGRLGSYLTRVIANAYYTLMENVRRQKRYPLRGLVYIGDKMDIDDKKIGNKELIKALTDGTPNIEESAIIAEQAQAMVRAIKRTRQKLNKMEKIVAGCYEAPPPELLIMIRNLGRRRISKLALATYLGISPDRLRSIICRIQKKVSSSVKLEDDLR